MSSVCQAAIVFAALFAVFVQCTTGCMDTSNCSDVCYPSQPPPLTYMTEGEARNFTVELSSMTTLFLYTSSKDGVTTNANSNLCNPGNCAFDANGPILRVTHFNSSVVGSYNFLINGKCSFTFNISQGVAPTISKEPANSVDPIVLDSDSGALQLAPVVNHGTPPGEVHWYKDGVFLQTGDTYTIISDPPKAVDRGFYTANISNAVGDSSITYEIRVEFAPITVLTTDPADTHPDITNSPITVTCTTIAYPIITSIELTADGQSVGTTHKDNSLQSGLYYTANVVYTIPSGCPRTELRCSVSNTKFDSSSVLTICQKAPTISKVDVDSLRSTNSSIHLYWELNLDGDIGAIDGFTVRYRRNGDSSYSTVFIEGSNMREHLITNLQPGTTYELSVQLVDESNSTQDPFFSPAFNFTTFRRPEYRPIGLNLDPNETAIELSWMEPINIPTFAPIEEYQIFYNDGSTQSMSTVSGNRFQFVLTPYDMRLSYTFTVRAINKYGSGDISAEVHYRPKKDNEDSLYLNITLSVTVGSDMALLSWTRPQSLDSVSYLQVIIERLENSDSSSDVTLYPVITYNITDIESSTKCFSRLNTSEIYRFCLQAYRRDNHMVHPVCTFGATASDGSIEDLSISDADSCVAVVERSVGDQSGIPVWAIVAMVVGTVLLLFVFFGACGLFFGLKRNKKGDLDFDDPPEVFDQMSPNGVNGVKYPYPPSHRATSPPSSRNCMSYRNNNHGHHMDWQGVTAV